jgi:uncharacterized protein YecE (DUF72 family)
MATRIGPAGWSYDDWKGIVYPKGAPSKFDPLSYLAEYFDTIEINSTFYRPATSAMAKSWARRVEHNPQFKFTAKLWNRFTHEKEAYSAQEVGEYKKGIEPLHENDRLGALLIQFPWSFKNFEDERGRLERIISQFKGYPLVLEVRHNSWNRPEVFDFLREQGVGFCNIDQPVIGQSLKPSSIVTSEVGYFRLHGRNYKNWFKEDAGRDARYDYLYTSAELDSLVNLVKDIKVSAPETYVITNNHYRGKAVVNALEIKTKLTGETPKAPPSLVAEYPQLRAEGRGPRAEERSS